MTVSEMKDRAKKAVGVWSLVGGIVIGMVASGLDYRLLVSDKMSEDRAKIDAIDSRVARLESSQVSADYLKEMSRRMEEMAAALERHESDMKKKQPVVIWGGPIVKAPGRKK